MALEKQATATMEGSDQDGEHDNDQASTQAYSMAIDTARNLEAEGSDLDAEGEEIDEDQAGEIFVDAEVPVLGSAATPGSSKEDRFHSNAGTEAGNTESSEDGESWEGSSSSETDEGEEIVGSTHCVFCGEDEEHDPSEDFEEYLACAFCGDNAHRQCAREAHTLSSEDDPQHWRCPQCVANGLEETKDEPKSLLRRQSSAPNIARDLLPSSRGAIKPDSHSVFNTLILDDDPMDGSRSLRKRKSSGDDYDQPQRQERKRQRKTIDESSEDEYHDASTGSPLATTSPTFPARAVTNVVRGLSPDADGPQSTRLPRRQRNRRHQIATTPGLRLLVSLRVDPTELKTILSRKPQKRRNRIRVPKPDLPPEKEVPHYPPLSYGEYAPPLYSFHEREQDDVKVKPYGGILDEVEADTSKTYPLPIDRKRFEDARQKAEEDWKVKTAAAVNDASESHYTNQKVSGPPSKIKCINFGGFEIDTWHAAPYPEEYSRNRVLYICEFCLKYMSSDYVAWRHKLKCSAKHPPGDEIYRDGPFSFFEVDGRKNPVYCQNLCLLAKLFLGSKTLYYDVEPFLFYVMTENDELGCHFVGYFSKEKRSSSLNNVSCILVLPIHQRRGFGHFLIEFSYLLTRVEKKTGSPEKPLSDMGLVSYRSYWRLVLCYQLVDQKGSISINQLSERTGMTADDIVSALEGLRGLVKDPATGTYALRLDYPYYREYIENYEKKGYTKINPSSLTWTPYVMGRTNLGHYEEAPPLQTVAQREGDQGTETPEEGVQNAKEAGAEVLQASDIADTSSKSENAATPGEDSDNRSFFASAVQSPLMTDPATPKVNGDSSHSQSIPAWRFQVWPSLSGSVGRRRPGRPFGNRRSSGTPVRRSAYSSEKPGVARLTNARRTRSKLGEVVDGVNGPGSEQEDDEVADQGQQLLNGTDNSVDGLAQHNGISHAPEDVVMDDG